MKKVTNQGDAAMKAVRELRLSLGWTQKELAKALNVSEVQAGRYERTQPPRTLRVLMELLRLANREAKRYDLRDIFDDWLITQSRVDLSLNPETHEIGEVYSDPDINRYFEDLSATEWGFLGRTLAFIRECEDTYRLNTVKAGVNEWFEENPPQPTEGPNETVQGQGSRRAPLLVLTDEILSLPPHRRLKIGEFISAELRALKEARAELDMIDHEPTPIEHLKQATKRLKETSATSQTKKRKKTF